MTTRTDVLPTFDINAHYKYLVYQKLDADTAYQLLGQLKNIDVNGQADQKEYKRVGDQNATKRAGSIAWDVTVVLYDDNDFEEVARCLGAAKPSSGGWIGTETVILDPTKISDFQIKKFDGVTTAANLLSTESLSNFKPAGLKAGIDAEGDARTYEISGSIDSWQWSPQAGMGAS
jgi:hypothetical protein